MAISSIPKPPGPPPGPPPRPNPPAPPPPSATFSKRPATPSHWLGLLRRLAISLKHARRWRWRQKFRADFVLDRLGENLVNLPHGVSIELPAHCLVERCDLFGPAGTPKRKNLAAIEQPANAAREHGLAVGFGRQDV